MTTLDKQLDLAKDIARQAGKIMTSYFRDGAPTNTKDDGTVVTSADIEINQLVIDSFTKETPEYSIWGEEKSVIHRGAEFTWVCDPIDGTAPFAKKIPISTFSLALVNGQGVSVLGVVYDPFTDRLFEAVKSQGAFMNNESIRVSKVDSLRGASIDQELWVNNVEGVSFEDPRGRFAILGAQVSVQCSAVLTGCLTASGAFDAMLFGQSKPEDIAALAVIVPEAGGKVTDLYGNKQRYDQKIQGAVVSNGLFHDQLIEITNSMNYKSLNL
ncbi:TPA: inositol monophosphatase [Candidatus Saccharibacteria bacterium]|nr:inositol monophosphatase [Candidatus Saccharibacteria bacterium]HIO87215.1 inositol monophosphatase [Candidatus Saccharibacteria bacterium]